ncbi:MAG TPA: hypothetical protein PKD95_03555 [Candidatus Paceibacterota bacterium]|nr:hypothetical protein [Candidatus Paceibacterota bacterium]
MEGSRHEKAAVTIASYAIGFITAFILYANINTPSQSNFVVPLPSNNNIAGVAAAEPALPQTDESATSPGVNVIYSDGLLEVTMADTTNLLSFNPEVSKDTIDIADLKQGYHYGDLRYVLSEDQNFVFFCERHDVEDTSCAGFVYDIDADRIYPVIKDGAAVIISERSAKDAIWTLFGLKIGSHYSANPQAPWVLISADSPLDLQ